MVSFPHPKAASIPGNDLPGFENRTAKPVSRKFLENCSNIEIANRGIKVYFKKKPHLPLLIEVAWMKRSTKLPWVGVQLSFDAATCP